MLTNIYAALIGFLLGTVAGLVSGLSFHDEQFLGGYGSWRRRLVRLAHISFFGIGLLNLTLALTARHLAIEDGLVVSSVLLIVAAVAMPSCCYLAAYRARFRHLFAIPVLSIFVAVAIFLWRVITR